MRARVFIHSCFQVTGEANVKQVVMALKAYKHRPRFLINALRELFNIIRFKAGDVLNTDMCDVSVLN